MAETVKATRKRKPGRPPKAASGAPAATDLLTQDDLVAMYRDMLLIRRFEERPDSFTAWARSAVSATSISVRKP